MIVKTQAYGMQYITTSGWNWKGIIVMKYERDTYYVRVHYNDTIIHQVNINDRLLIRQTVNWNNTYIRVLWATWTSIYYDTSKMDCVWMATGVCMHACEILDNVCKITFNIVKLTAFMEEIILTVKQGSASCRIRFRLFHVVLVILMGHVMDLLK